jgi:hypothetical protein
MGKVKGARNIIDKGIGHPFSACFRNQVTHTQGLLHFLFFLSSPARLLYDCNQNLVS